MYRDGVLGIYTEACKVLKLKHISINNNKIIKISNNLIVLKLKEQIKKIIVVLGFLYMSMILMSPGFV